MTKTYCTPSMNYINSTWPADEDHTFNWIETSFTSYRLKLYHDAITKWDIIFTKVKIATKLNNRSCCWWLSPTAGLFIAHFIAWSKQKVEITVEDLSGGDRRFCDASTDSEFRAMTWISVNITDRSSVNIPSSYTEIYLTLIISDKQIFAGSDHVVAILHLWNDKNPNFHLTAIHVIYIATKVRVTIRISLTCGGFFDQLLLWASYNINNSIIDIICIQ